MKGLIAAVLVATWFVSGGWGPAMAQEKAPVVGTVTGLELPRYVSIKKRARARRGPGTKHRIDWIYQRENLPVRVINEYGHWRHIVDSEGQGGWIHYALLSNTRYVLFTRDHHELRYRPSFAAKSMAFVNSGVVALLEKCEPDWCQIELQDYKGWVHKSGLWGVDPGEVVE